MLEYAPGGIGTNVIRPDTPLIPVVEQAIIDPPEHGNNATACVTWSTNSI